MGIDTGNATGKLMLTLLGGVVEFERSIMLEKGIAKASTRDANTAKAKTEEVLALHAEGVGATEIAKRLSIGRANVYRILAGSYPVAFQHADGCMRIKLLLNAPNECLLLLPRSLVQCSQRELRQARQRCGCNSRNSILSNSEYEWDWAAQEVRSSDRSLWFRRSVQRERMYGYGVQSERYGIF